MLVAGGVAGAVAPGAVLFGPQCTMSTIVRLFAEGLFIGPHITVFMRQVLSHTCVPPERV